MTQLAENPAHWLGNRGKLGAFFLLGGAVVFSTQILAGCQSTQPAAATVEAMTGEDEPWKPLLTVSEERRAIAAMNSTRIENADVKPRKLSIGPPRGRWADVPDAARLAAAEVEMALVTSRSVDGAWEFVFRTIENTPATMRVQPTDDANVWTATATVGLFGLQNTRSQDLLDAFETKMRALSKKRKFE